ncbi:MAG: outer membrane protein transport protein [Gallionella sp.]|jgi:long-chain fatty acid transport protein
MKLKKIVVSMFAVGVMASPLAHATNGMLMEGYGPIAAGMGGASMAYDNGNAGMANNPATLGLMADGDSRLDLAVGGLQPTVSATCPAGCNPAGGAATANSGGTAYYMPAGGWIKKSGQLAYGVGIFAQGGMGTEYAAADWVSGGTGKPTRSEVGVGNLIIPLAYNVTPDLNIGGSLDLVWGGMDMLMAMSGAQMGSMMAPGGSAAGSITVSAPVPTMTMLGTYLGAPGGAGYFNFSDNSKFTGKAKSTGYSGKLGMTYKVNPKLTVGATYHSKTSLGDLNTGSASMSVSATGMATQTMSGNVSVINFQFPETYGFGLAYQAKDDLMLVADYKRIGWAKVMQNMHMSFTSTDGSGVIMDMKLNQQWVDQNVFSFGGSYKATEALTLRAGASIANNPVPDSTDNPLFPAIVKNSYTMGAGYAFSKTSQVNGSLAYVPNVTSNTPATAVSPAYSVSHSQLNWQLMYSHGF